MLNYCLLPDPPNFSLLSTFKTNGGEIMILEGNPRLRQSNHLTKSIKASNLQCMATFGRMITFCSVYTIDLFTLHNIKYLYIY